MRICTAPCATACTSSKRGGLPGTSTVLASSARPFFRLGWPGSRIRTPSTTKLYWYISGVTGPAVAVHTPFASLVIDFDPPKERLTVLASGARRRNVMVRSGWTSGETNRCAEDAPPLEWYVFFGRG